MTTTTETTMMSARRTPLARLWRTDPLLTATGLAMTAALAVFLAGVWLDPRTILGAPAWMKPAKFAASTALYAFTLAWIFAALPGWPRLRRWLSRLTAGVFVLEVGIIALQAARGTTSHFNVATPFDTVLWRLMGLAIVAQTLASISVAVALWRQHIPDAAMGWALRLGMAITIAGAASGGLMARPTGMQVDDALKEGRVTTAGAHTVGAEDGGPGLPVVGWSREHGDLRVPHFIGLHAIQALPLLAFALRRLRRSDAVRTRLVLAAASSYALLFVLLMWQALRGQPLFQPDAVTVGALTAWLASTVAASALTSRRSHRRADEAGAAPEPGNDAAAGFIALRQTRSSRPS